MNVIIKDFPCLKQNDYGGDNDCTLTSITAIVYHLLHKKVSPEIIYSNVLRVSKKYCYTDKNGTLAITIRSIFEEVLKSYKLYNKRTQLRLFKGFGYNFLYICKEIDRGNPVILSLLSSPRYHNHTVTIVGYDKANERFIIADNWSSSFQHLPYKDISFISSVNYM